MEDPKEPSTPEPGTPGTVESPFNGWYTRDPCVEWTQFDPERFYVLDGGLGTLLGDLRPDKGQEADKDPLWACGLNYTNPDVVRQAHRTFLKAGANIVTTNTYQCSMELFQNHLSLPHPVVDSARLFGRALQLADEAAEEETRGDALVAASVGPFGACRHDGSEYTGSYADSMSREELGEWHFERVKRLTAAGARFLAVETIPCVKEALAVLDVVKRFPGVRCWLTFQCREASCTARGERLDRAIRELLLHPAFPSQLSAVGVNCVAPEHVAPLLRLANKVNRYEEWEEHPDFRPLPYVVYPNSGEKWEGREWKGEKGDLDDDLVGRVPLWMKLGANVVGGCCRVGPDMISRIRDKVRECTFDVFEYRRKHASVDRRRGPEAVRRRMRELGELESRPKKEEVLVPSDLVGRTEMLPPGHVDKDLAEARLRAIFQHFEVKYPLDKEGGGADDEEGRTK